MKNHYQILIIGGGTAGIMVASQLKRKNSNLEIGLIEPSDKHYYQPAWTLGKPASPRAMDTYHLHCVRACDHS